jgi:hypothetical protein
VATGDHSTVASDVQAHEKVFRPIPMARVVAIANSGLCAGRSESGARSDKCQTEYGTTEKLTSPFHRANDITGHESVKDSHVSQEMGAFVAKRFIGFWWGVRALNRLGN